MILRHAFVPGQSGTYLEVYCQAPREAGTDPFPGAAGHNCGWPELRHTMTPEQEHESDDEQADRLVEEIYNGKRER